MSAIEAVARGAFTRPSPPKSRSCASLVITHTKRLPNSGASRLRIRSLSLFNNTISARAAGHTSKLHCEEEEAMERHCAEQWEDAMGWSPKIKWKTERGKTERPKSMWEAIIKNLPQSDLIEKSSVAGTDHKIVLLNWIAERIQKLLVDGIETWAPSLPITRAVVDFSTPNSAEEIHFGHLRPAIIGDCLSRMLEFSKVEVLRRNHVSGCWGTQFGMLIEHLFEEFPNWDELGEQAIGDLQSFYKASKVKFDNDPAFKKRAQEAVARLQGGDVEYRKAWKRICDISRNQFDQVYKRLKIQLEEEGENFYSPYIPIVLQELEGKGLIEISEDAKVNFFEGRKNPIIVVKRDGGLNYAYTDMAALWYRLHEEKAQWIIYVTDVGQSDHFEFLFSAAKRAGWFLIDNGDPYPKASHVGLGLVHGNHGKHYRTFLSHLVRLVDLLDEAKNRTREDLIFLARRNEWTAEEYENAAEAIEYGALKFANLMYNRVTNYTFDHDQMLDAGDGTAFSIYLEHGCICSILRTAGKDIDELKKRGSIQLKHNNEIRLGLHLIRFTEIVKDACMDLSPNTLCKYLYDLSKRFKRCYSTCKVVGGSEEETSRLLLFEATAIVMRECFKLMGITPLYKL